MLSHLKKISNPKELKFRVGQSLWNALDQLRRREDTGAHVFACGQANTNFLNPYLVKRPVNEPFDKMVARYFPGLKDQLITECNKIVNGHFNLLGYKDLSFGSLDNINWHYDPVNKAEAPKVWWSKIDLNNDGAIWDPKVIWELNRHQFLVKLGIAYRITHRRRYKSAFLKFLDSWFKANPPKIGVNWASSLELAYRTIAWIWSFYLFDAGADFPDEIRKNFFSYINLQAEHISHNLSLYHSPNTHLTGEALGLFYIALFCQEFESAAKWFEKGNDILLTTLSRHVLNDGGYVERSLWYHRYTLDIYLHFYLLAQSLKFEISTNVRNTLESLAEFLLFASSPDRQLPLIGDDDGGRLLPLDNLDGRDLRGLFSTLAVVLRRGDFKFLSEGYQEETFWLLGPDSKEKYDAIEVIKPSSTFNTFPETGYFFIRNNWSENANYLVFDCGPHGWLNCGHAHADLLSFQIYAGKIPIFVDRGTHTYCGERRDEFRGPDGHCTIKVDKYYPAIPDGPFSWKKTPSFELLTWEQDDLICRVSGKMIAKDRWVHKRDIIYLKPGLYIIFDTLDGNGQHEIEMRFPLGGRTWEIADDSCIAKDGDFECTIKRIPTRDLEAKLINTNFSTCYGNSLPNKTLVFCGRVDFPYYSILQVNLSDTKYEVLLKAESTHPVLEIVDSETKRIIFHYEEEGN